MIRLRLLKSFSSVDSLRIGSTWGLQPSRAKAVNLTKGMQVFFGSLGDLCGVADKGRKNM